MNYWLCVTNEENWNIVKERGIWGVESRHLEKIASVKEKDQLVFYVKPKRIGGIFEVTSKMFKEENVIFKGGLFPYRIKIRPVVIPKKFLEFQPLIHEMRFIASKKRKWGGYLQGKAMRPIPKQDFELIKKRVEVHEGVEWRANQESLI